MGPKELNSGAQWVLLAIYISLVAISLYRPPGNDESAGFYCPYADCLVHHKDK